MNADAAKECAVAAVFGVGFVRLLRAVFSCGKSSCQEARRGFIPLDNFRGYPLYSEGFSLRGRARPIGFEDVSW